MDKRGTLYLVPAALGGDPGSVLPPRTRERLFALADFVVENPKSARQFLKAAGYPYPLQSVRMHVLDEHTPETALPELLAPVLAGQDCGLLSEAGCPAVADPGALLVRLAHESGVRVVPLVGPSAVLLALMASGLNGQRFAFHGYLPVQAAERRRRLQDLERESQRGDCTQIFIEAPYRNNSLLRAILDACRDDTLLCLATDISVQSEAIKTRPVKAWRNRVPDLDRRPTVFLLYSKTGR
jgi:16S rRNA (cytidine1402-2'-O)-methyltransferase